MAGPFMAYYEHIAKLARVANKQTIFLSHMLSEMEFDRESRQYTVDMSVAKKHKIMEKVSPAVPKDKALANANQYLNKLKLAGLIQPIGMSQWLVDPESFGQSRFVSKGLREENGEIFSEYSFGRDGIEGVRTYYREKKEKSQTSKKGAKRHD